MNMRKFLTSLCLLAFAGLAHASNFPMAVDSDSNLFVAVNNCHAALGGTVTGGATTISVDSASCFPSPGYATIDSEAIYYTGKTATTLTGCTRGADGTMAAAHSVRSTVFHAVLAAHHNALKDELIAISTTFLQGSQFRMDFTNTRLGIGTGSPASTLDVAGDFNVTQGGTISSHVIQKSITISGNTSWTGERSVPYGTTITVNNGVTLTINGHITAGAYTIFAGAGTVVFGTSQQARVLPEWFGAVGNGSTNDTAAIQAAINSLAVPYGGRVEFGPKVYATSATITVPYGHTTLAGTNREWYASGGSRILNLSTSNNIIQIHGADAAHALQMNTIENIGVGRNLTTDAAGIGVSVRFANTTRLTNVTVENCYAAVKAYDTANLFIENSFLTRPATMPAGNSFGIWLDESDAGNVSVRLSHDIISFPTPPHTGVGYGIYIYGPTLTDIFIEHNDVSWADYGTYVQGTSNSVLTSQDIHLIDNIIDSYVSVGNYVQGIDAHGTVSIIGGWTAPVFTGATTYGIQIYQASGVTVTGHQAYGYLNYAHHTGIAVQNSTGCVLGHNVIRDSVTGISMSTAQNTVLNGNSIYAASASPGTYGIQFVASSSNTVSGNNLYGYITNGITFDANSKNNNVYGNSMDTKNITTPITDSGSGNSLYLQNLSAGALSVDSLGKTVSGTASIANGGTNSSTALSGSTIMISDGSKIVQGAAGTTTTLLHGNAGGAPTYAAASLTADVSGTLPAANGGTGNTGGAWTVYGATVTAWIAGSIGTSHAEGRYQTIGKNTCFSVKVSFTGTVTATGFFVSLPNSAQSTVAIPGWVDVTGGAVQGISNVSGAAVINGYNVAGGAFTPTTAYIAYFNGCYENQ